MKLKPAEGRVLKPASPEAAPIAEALAATIRAVAPRLKESIAWGNLCFSGQGWVLSIVAHKAHVNLQFEQGTGLAALGAVLDGTGKSLRHLKIISVDDAQSGQVRQLIAQAVSLDEERTDV